MGDYFGGDRNRRFHKLAALLLFALITIQSPANASDDRPNILLIVADDLGYADLGYKGSRIKTPNIDQLAADGLVFSRFHTAPMCAPTRAMLLSGNNNHVAGVGRQHPGKIIQALPGYEGVLSDRIVPFPKILKDAGYHTYIAGKWHLGDEAEHSPRAAGFERSYVLTRGAANHWDQLGFDESGSSYREDGELVTYPAGEYSTTFYTRKILEYIDANRKTGKPFFAATMFTSPHWPLQVPDDELDLYAGQFDDGYERLWEDNIDSLRARGFVPEAAAAPERDARIPPWIDLSPQQRREESRKMELYAAMVDNLDRHIGQILSYLKANILFDNTLIIFMSDNGAASADFYNRGPYVEFIRKHYDNRYDNMGKPGSFVSYGLPWAEAGSASFKGQKWRTNQGGILAPMLMTGPVISRAGMTADYVTVMDIAPTLLDVAGADYPADEHLKPMLGESMLPFLEGSADHIHTADYKTVLHHRGYGYARQGDWKIVTESAPFSESAFKLYNVVADPGETNNLREAHPEQFSELLRIWRQKTADYGVLLPRDL